VTSPDIPSRLSTALADRYRIERELGAGGMATVYLAEDLKHHRQVAIKVLRPELAAVLGADRFVQEIQTTAQLQHPHILPLFDSGEADGFLFYVMPYIEGETLREKLNRETQLSVDEAVKVTVEVADALQYAHEQGVIHRDIKPENILLHAGRPMVADFGIALALSAAAGGRMTETGMSLGTPHYMSPEQATADKDITGRSDIYSLASVLYEMLTGNPPHVGSSAQQIIMKIVTDQARPVTELRKNVPANVAAAAAKALEKLPADRFDTAKAFAEALTNPAFTIAGTGPSGAAVLRRSRMATVLPWALLAAAVVVIALLGAKLATGSKGRRADVVRATVVLPPGLRLVTANLDLSADGQHLLVPGVRGDTIFLLQRVLDDTALHVIPGTEGATNPFLSPDAKWVAFSQDGKLRKVPLGGGPVVDVADGGFGGVWTGGGAIIYAKAYNSGLWRVPEGGGTPTPITTPDSTHGELGDWWPQVLPDGDHVLFTAYSSPIARARIEVVSLKTGERKVLVEGGVNGKYVPPGYLLYARDGTIFAVTFDAGRLAVTGQPVPVVQGVAMQSASGLAAFDVAGNGLLAYVTAGTLGGNHELVWVTRSGRVSPPVTAPGRYGDPSISPNGNRVAVSMAAANARWDVWILDLVRGTRTPITSGGANNFDPVFTPDGREVVYQCEHPVFDLCIRPADGSTPSKTLLASSHDKYPVSITPDGRTLLYHYSLSPYSEIWSLSLGDSGKATPLMTSKAANLTAPRIAPNGRWLAYVSDESGPDQVYLSPYPDIMHARTQVSVSGGLGPHWTRGGKELVYRTRSGMMAVSVNPTTGALGAPVELFRGDYVGATNAQTLGGYDVTPDGERFLMVRRVPGTEARSIVVVTNWIQELEREVGR